MLATSKPRARPAPSATLRRGTVITGSNSFRLRHSPPQERVRLGPKWAQLGYGVVCPGGLRSCLLTSARATYRRKPAQAALHDLRVRPGIGASVQEGAPANLESRRPESNRGPNHYEETWMAARGRAAAPAGQSTHRVGGAGPKWAATQSFDFGSEASEWQR